MSPLSLIICYITYNISVTIKCAINALTVIECFILTSVTTDATEK